jgi:2-methylcitrate dehydratase PrpD
MWGITLSLREKMGLEKVFAEYVSGARFEHLPKEPVDTTKNLILTVLGTTIGGATAEGCEAVVHQVKEWGGRGEATILIHGGKVPAHNAAFANSVMARALDFCDGMTPGIHLGSSSVPTAIATAELAGGCNGKEFLTALVAGNEVAARLNLSASAYNGFDPTGVCSIFASTAIAGKIMRLDAKQMLNALALAFNRSGGSFQSNIDGSLAVRVIQGFVSQSGILCAQLARLGITGPENFLEGVYGYFHLYARDDYSAQTVLANLGKRFKMDNFLFKKYPSCGGTLASTDAILELMKENNLTPEDVDQIVVRVTPAVYNLTGHPFKIGGNPKVDAQFSIQYCVANALLRKRPELKHFDEPFVRDPQIMELVNKIQVTPDASLKERDHRTADMRVTTKDGRTCQTIVDTPRGYPENPLTEEEHHERFQSCIRYAGKPLPGENIEKIVSLVNQIEEVQDVRTLVPLLLS